MGGEGMTREALWQYILDANPLMLNHHVTLRQTSLRKMYDLVWDKAQEELAEHMNGRESSNAMPEFMQEILNGGYGRQG